MEKCPRERDKLRTVLFTPDKHQDLGTGQFSGFRTKEINVGEKLLKNKEVVMRGVIKQLLKRCKLWKEDRSHWQMRM